MNRHIIDFDTKTGKLDIYSVDEHGNRLPPPDLGHRVDHGTDKGRCRLFADMQINANRLPITCNRKEE